MTKNQRNVDINKELDNFKDGKELFEFLLNSVEEKNKKKSILIDSPIKVIKKPHYEDIENPDIDKYEDEKDDEYSVENEISVTELKSLKNKFTSDEIKTLIKSLLIDIFDIIRDEELVNNNEKKSIKFALDSEVYLALLTMDDDEISFIAQKIKNRLCDLGYLVLIDDKNINIFW